MSQYDRILVAYDFSGDADQALQIAVTLAGPLGARIELVYVYPRPMDLLTSLGVEVLVVSPPEYRRSAAVRLDQELEKARSAGIAGEWHYREGVPSDELVSAARELDADLIVMGTQGRSGLAHAMMGSVAERTVRRADCPVLTVRSPQSSSD